MTTKTKRAALILTPVLCLYLSSEAGATCAGLFLNPVTDVDWQCIFPIKVAGLPLAPLFWCMGSWGSAYPLTGHMNDDDYVQANAGAGARMIYKLGREGLLWKVEFI